MNRRAWWILANVAAAAAVVAATATLSVLSIIYAIEQGQP